MADELSGAVRRALADAVRGIVGGRTTVTRGTGTYVRTDADGTGWVLMAGADEPTPVNGRALIDAEPGDSVQWELDGTALSVTGNATTPAVGTRQVTREVKPVAERAEVAIEDAAQALEDAANAAGTATKYITDITDSGIWVTPSDAKPVSGAAAATTSGWHIADALELFRQGASVFKVWMDSAAKMWLRLGDEDGGHILMGPDEITINNGELEAYKITASAETDEESNTRYESWLELGGAYVHSTEYADSTGNTISNQNALVADNHMGEAAVSAESWVDEHDFYWGRRGGGESEVVATGHSAVNLSGNVLVLDDQHSSGTRTYPFDMTDVIATLRSGAGTILFSGSYSTTYSSAITGLPDLTDYARLLVEYEDSTGRKGSVWVDSPDGSTFSMQTVGGNSSAGMVTRFKTAVASGTTIDTQKDSYNRYTYGKVTVSPSGTVTYANAQEIGITKVVGFR